MIERLRLMKFGGIPVLFIPGNSGSHKQGKHILVSYHFYASLIWNLYIKLTN
jgi:hypothetical protein